MNSRLGITSVLVISLAAVAACTREVSYSRDVKPILQAKCLSCHDGSGEGSQKSGFSVKDYAGLSKGTKFGDVIVPGDAESSTLYRLVAHKTSPELHMPPHHRDSPAMGRAEPLTQDEIDTVKLWIDQGAKDN
ncbi:MAG TPA: c-type cytochrome domain-containing protein [Acidiferrobacterales bacterium]|jgi:hypothetical protein